MKSIRSPLLNAKTQLPVVFLFFSVLAAATGCSPASEPYALGPPQQWIGDGDRWWQNGVDTTGAFRNLETLRSMGLSGTDLVFVGSGGQSRSVLWQHVNFATKQELIELIRNEPEVVDSLFDMTVTPKIRSANLSADAEEDVKRFQREGYRAISRHFRAPFAIKSIGKEIPLSYPDSLRGSGASGSIRVQVRLDSEGVPVGVMKLEGIHAVIDDMIMKAITEMRWRPAYLLTGGSSDPIASWVRYRVRLEDPGA